MECMGAALLQSVCARAIESEMTATQLASPLCGFVVSFFRAKALKGKGSTFRLWIGKSSALLQTP